MATQKQIEANRRNAQRSTGPRTAEGKARARLNGLKYGLRSEEVVLPTEDPHEFQEFLAAWMADWRPATLARAQLVVEAASAAWRKRRCLRVETARMTRKARRGMAQFDRDREAEVESLIDQLDDDPCGAVAELTATRLGLTRLAEILEGLAEAAYPSTWDEQDAHHLLLFHALGREPGDDDVRDLFELSWRLYLRHDEELADEDFAPFDEPEAEAAAARLRDILLTKVDELVALIPSRPDTTADRAAAAEIAAFEPGPEDAPLLRYEGQLSRQFHRALGDLVKLTKSGADLVEDEPEAVAPSEANSVTEDISEDKVKTDSRVDSRPLSAATDGAETAEPAAPAVDRGRKGPTGPPARSPGRPAAA